MVGEDFCDVILHLFKTNYLLHEVNTTAITLIPKRSGADRMKISGLFLVAMLFTNVSKQFWLIDFVSGFLLLLVVISLILS